MNTVRVLLGNRPRMLRESLRRALERYADVEVELSEPDPVELMAALDECEADVVLITLPESGNDPGLASHLLHEYPGLLVIAISAADESAYVYRQVITKDVLEPLSEASLLTAIRSHHRDHERAAAAVASVPREGQ